jgi:hypothetical protein
MAIVKSSQTTMIPVYSNGSGYQNVILHPGGVPGSPFGAYNMSSTISIDEWNTDAYLLSITHQRNATASPVSVSRFFVLDASFLRHRQSSVMKSLSKVSCLWNPQRIRQRWQDSYQTAVIGLTNVLDADGQLTVAG